VLPFENVYLGILIILEFVWLFLKFVNNAAAVKFNHKVKLNIENN